MISIFDYIPDTCQFTLVPHIVLGLLFAASAVPSKWQDNARLGFHALFGALLYLAPCALSAPKVGHKLDYIHLFLQRFSGCFQIGFAYYYFRTRHDRYRPEPAFALAKALAAGLIFVHEFVHAHRHTSATERGLHFDSPNFYFALGLVEFAYAVAEIVNVVNLYRRTSSPEEIDIQCKRTQRLLEGRGSVRTSYFWWLDAVVSILYAVASINSSEYLYLNVIPHGIKLDSLHHLFTAEFGYYALATGIISLLAPQFTIFHQKAFVEMRFIVQSLVFFLHIFGSVAIYPFAQFVPHAVCLLTLPTLYQIKKDVDEASLPEDLPDQDGGVVTTHFRQTKNRANVNLQKTTARKQL